MAEQCLSDVSRTSSSDNAAQTQVFDTVELLEAILQHVPFRELLLSQRVCTRFRHVIASSVALRRRLHLEPARPPSSRLLDMSPAGVDLYDGVSLWSPDFWKLAHVRMHELPPEGSWQGMYPVQPPPLRIGIVGRNNTVIARITAHEVQYLTLGVVVSALRAYSEQVDSTLLRSEIRVKLINDDTKAQSG